MKPLRKRALTKQPRFFVREWSDGVSSTPHTFSLVRDNWDDFGFKTSYVLHYTDDKSDTHEIGPIKIGEFGLGQRGGSPSIPPQFSRFEALHFSVAQEREYYERLLQLGSELGKLVLVALRDIAYEPELFEAAVQEPVTQTSLFRSVAAATVENQFRRIAWGGLALTPYDFSYHFSEQPNGKTPRLNFVVKPYSRPPSNVHVLIGSNGAGKTTLLRHMANAATGSESEQGYFVDAKSRSEEVPFVNLVTVTFSAFDPFDPTMGTPSKTSTIKSSYVGLKTGDSREEVKSTNELADDFLASIRACARGARRDRWRELIEILTSDPLFADSEIITLLTRGHEMPNDEEIASKFSALSSGHKIVLLTVTRLVETVEEKSLVLMDEPEAHLHPPLLSAFTRAISYLLEDRNGVAIIATHSPVILQEVPKTCVYRISRVGNIITPERLGLETFGEDVGALTSAVFGLEVTHTGFHRILLESLDEAGGSYRKALNSFDSQLGGVARAILRSRADDGGGR